MLGSLLILEQELRWFKLSRQMVNSSAFLPVAEPARHSHTDLTPIRHENRQGFGQNVFIPLLTNCEISCASLTHLSGCPSLRRKHQPTRYSPLAGVAVRSTTLPSKIEPRNLLRRNNQACEQPPTIENSSFIDHLRLYDVPRCAVTMAGGIRSSKLLPPTITLPIRWTMEKCAVSPGLAPRAARTAIPMRSGFSGLTSSPGMVGAR